MEDIPKVNTGLIEGSGTKSLWIAGAIPYEVRLASGDWRPFVPDGERQANVVETMACVSFSCTNDLETQNKFYGIDVNYSDRFLAKMSGTTHDGNYVDKVADTVRTIGLVTEAQYPAPPDYTWDSYYSEVPASVVAEAVKPVIMYEAIPFDATSLQYHLKQSPIQITIPQPHPNHAVLLVYLKGTTAYYFDSYSPFLKTIDVSKIAYALKIVLTKGQNMFKVKKVKINGAYGALVDTPNGAQILKATNEEEWRSFSKADSYQLNTVNADGTANYTVDVEINF